MADEDFQKQLELEELEKIKKERSAIGVVDPYTYVDPHDGMVYEWDTQKQAWFPKLDEDFIAKYQANYNYEAPESESNQNEEPSQPVNASRSEKRKANEPGWFDIDDDHNTNVYVSGMPNNTNEEEFVELMSKCGLIMKDPDSMKYKIKLYRDSDGTLKGDARCCYIKIESVKLALDILDGYIFKGKKIHVERAQFQLKGQYDPTKKPKKKKTKDKEKLKKKLEKLFDWRPDKLRGMRSRNENTIIIKNMFDPKEFEEDATLLLDYQSDIREECVKCGEVKKVVIYDRNPEGVVAVTFAEPEMADECINLMNGRWFAARQLTAETWDGKTKYKIVETEQERAGRLKSWEKYLEGQEGNSTGCTTQRADKQYASTGSLNCKLNVSNSMYELAGETDSSGDSDVEGISDAKILSQNAYPVMQANGKFMTFPASGSSSS